MEFEELLNELEEIYGFKTETFKDYEFMKKQNRIYIINKDCANVKLGNLNVEGKGILFARSDKTLKLTTNAIQIFGKHASKRVVELTEEQTNKFVKRKDIFDFEIDLKDGYVIVKYKNLFLGCGQLKNQILKSLIPKYKRLHYLE